MLLAPHSPARVEQPQDPCGSAGAAAGAAEGVHQHPRVRCQSDGALGTEPPVHPWA